MNEKKTMRKEPYKTFLFAKDNLSEGESFYVAGIEPNYAFTMAKRVGMYVKTTRIVIVEDDKENPTAIRGLKITKMA